jgi:hypothetical protein
MMKKVGVGIRPQNLQGLVGKGMQVTVRGTLWKGKVEEC